MNKSLLLFVLALTSYGLASAVVNDGQTYEPVNDIKIVNQWILDRVHTPTEYQNSSINSSNCRTATMLDGVIYVGHSGFGQAYIDGVEDPISTAVIHRFKVVDGSPLPDLELTYNGQPYGGLLAVTSIGHDDFGHLWVAPVTSTSVNAVPVYIVDVETGELTLVNQMSKGDEMQRTDYLDVMGDLTREQAECNVMTVANSSNEPGFPTVYRWHCDQGSDTWEGGFEDDISINILLFYPDFNTGFSLAPIVKMMHGLDEDTYYSGEWFYIDAHNAAPVIYDVTGSLIDSFEFVDEDLRPQDSPNGCMEFTLDGRNFLVYVMADMHNDGQCEANICELGGGEAATLEGMTRYWQIPADGLGTINDGGLRVHCFDVAKTVEDGEEVITLLTFKSCNGMAIYKIGKGVTDTNPVYAKGDIDGNGIIDVEDVNAAINIALKLNAMGDYPGTADMDGNGIIDVADVNAIINIILKIN